MLIRKNYFEAEKVLNKAKDDYELIGIEVPLNANLINNVEFVGFIDILLKYKHTNRYKIIDIKTMSFRDIYAEESLYLIKQRDSSLCSE